MTSVATVLLQFSGNIAASDVMKLQCRVSPIHYEKANGYINPIIDDGVSLPSFADDIF